MFDHAAIFLNHHAILVLERALLVSLRGQAVVAVLEGHSDRGVVDRESILVDGVVLAVIGFEELLVVDQLEPVDM